MDGVEKAMSKVDRVEEAGSRRHYVKWSGWRRQEAGCEIVSVEEAEAAGSMKSSQGGSGRKQEVVGEVVKIEEPRNRRQYKSRQAEGGREAVSEEDRMEEAGSRRQYVK